MSAQPPGEVPSSRDAAIGRAAEAALVLIVCLVPVSLYRDFFAGDSGPLRLLGAATLGWLLALVALRRRWPARTVTIAAVVCGLVTTLYLAFPAGTWWGVPRVGTLRSLVTGLGTGWARMLTVTLPSDATGVLLATPLVVSFTTTLAATLISARRTAVLAPLWPPVMAFVAGLAMTAPVDTTRTARTAVLLTVALLLALLRANKVGETTAQADGAATARPALGRIAFGVPIVAAAVALGITAAQALPIADGDQRFDPRDLRAQQLDVHTTLSPLVLVRNQLETDPARTLFTVGFGDEGPAAARAATSGGGPPVDRLRVATLDRFDGALWTGPSLHLMAGTRLPPGDDDRVNPPLVAAGITIERLRGPFLPSAGRPVQVRATDVAFNEDAGTLVTSRTLRGYRYEVVAALDVTSAQLPADAVPGGVEPAVRAATVPPQLIGVADAVADAAGARPVAQLRAIEAYLRDTFPYDLERPPGHSYGALGQMLLGDERAGAGYAEQLASAFAVLAGARGYPARVVVGYLLDDPPDADGVYEITTADAHAWPEVHFADHGWVRFEPTDLEQRAAFTPSGDEDLVETDTEEDVADPPEVVRPRSAAHAEQRPAGQGLGAALGRAAAAGVLGLLVLLALLPLVVLAVKAVRRRRRRSRGDPAGRILGAWHETTDRLRERGMVVTTTQTADEIAAGARTRWGAQSTAPVAGMTPLVGSAIFAPWEPDPETAQQAWALESEARRALRRDLTLLVRARAAIDPRPLLPLPRNAPASAPGDPAAAPGDPSAATEPLHSTR